MLIEGAGRSRGTLNHLGVEVESTDEVAAAQRPAGRRGPGHRHRGRRDLLLRVQDKVWVDDPDGEPWEIYTVLADVEMPAGQLRTVDPAPARMCCVRHAESAGACCC